jgi:predicted RNase H-like nuclease (RuvC/YqgF family)
VSADDPEKSATQATWQKIATDIERLALENDDLKRTLEELQRECLETFNDNERMKRLLRDHNIPITGGLS